ncbi:MAG: hypothetical protein ACFBSF_18615 [Leptolyngbyaceae cyanobacterium]
MALLINSRPSRLELEVGTTPIIHSEILGQLDQVNDEAELTKFKAELQNINQKIEYFHVLNSAASIDDTVLHSPLMIEEFRESK